MAKYDVCKVPCAIARHAMVQHQQGEAACLHKKHSRLYCRHPLHCCREIQAHISEPFWTISVWYRAPGESCEFSWARQRLYDQASAVLLHEMCLEVPIATVLEVGGIE